MAEGLSAAHAKLRDDANSIFRAGLAAVDPAAAVRRALTLDGGTLVARGAPEAEVRLPLAAATPVYVCGAGKAAAAMAAAVEALLGDRVRGGLVVVKDGHQAPTRRVEVVAAGHPRPDARSAAAAGRLRQLLGRVEPEALVIAVISGGGSALLAAPAPGLSLDDKQEVTGQLLRCGATIQELNLVRRALSAIKGGGLARAAGAAPVLALIISDVVGDDLALVASGPTVLTPPAPAAARAVLTRHGLWEAAPAAVRRHLAAAAPATAPAEADQAPRVHNLRIADNATCLRACAERARALGYTVQISTAPIVGEARQRGGELAARARQRQTDPSAPTCLVAGGETTVRVVGAGRGGRNQELALGAALALDGAAGVAVLSAGTDGTDHIAEAAGAVALGDSVARGRAAGVDARDCLRRNDAFAFFSAIGDLVVTGPTLTNVMDVQLVLVA